MDPFEFMASFWGYPVVQFRGKNGEQKTAKWPMMAILISPNIYGCFQK